ncbi:MAG: S8 family serine peptidase [Bacteroidota bacterium]
MNRFCYALLIAFCCINLGNAQTTYTVNTNDDFNDGICDAVHCSLREAIEAANQGENNTILFAYPVDSIAPDLPLPVMIGQQTTIDGSSLPQVVLNGKNTIANGLIVEANQVTIKGLTIFNFVDNGLVVHDASEVTIGGDLPHLGNTLKNNGRDGLFLSGNTSSSTIWNNTISDNNFYGIRGSSSSSNHLITQNSIFCNRIQGIHLLGGSQPAAPLVEIANNQLILGQALPEQTIELFQNLPQDCETDNHCQATNFLGTVDVGGDGRWTFESQEAGLFPGHSIAATATENGENTSEISNCQVIGDSCRSAYELSVFDAPCSGTPIIADLTWANPSLATNFPVDACATDYDVRDLWFKVIVPASGNLLLRHHTLDSLETLVEVLSGDCEEGFISLSCDTLYQEANLVFITNRSEGETLYLRIWDDGNDEVGLFQLSAHQLPVDLNEATICDGQSGSGERKPNEFIIQYTPTATTADIQQVRNELIALGDVQLVDSCACASPKLDLWRVDNPIDLEDRRKGAKRKLAVDTVNYNFIIRNDDPMMGTGQAIDSINSPAGTSTQISSIKIAVIDSGIDENHRDLTNAIWTEANNGCVGDDPVGIGYDFINDDFIPADVDGHGTSVNGIVVLRTPLDIELQMINGKFYQDGNGSLFDAICAMHYVIEQDARVMNLSWGFKNGGIPSILDKAITDAMANDILLVSSAGNTYEDNDQIDKWPANAVQDNMITVAAIEIDDLTGDTSLAPYSNYGLRKVHLTAMGFAKTTTQNDMLDDRAGTSIAAPFVTQTAAIIRAKYPNLTFMEVKECILNSVVKLDVLLDTVQTGGVLDQTAALACANAKSGICTENLDLNLVEEGNRTYRASNAITSTSTIMQGATITYNAANSITLGTNFQASAGSQFNAVITSCPANLSSAAEELPTVDQAPIHFPKTADRPKTTLLIYPNPSNDLITIEYEIEEAVTLQFRLWNANGQMIKHPFFPNTVSSVGQFQMEVSTLSPGIYFLQMSSSQSSIVKKLVVERS